MKTVKYFSIIVLAFALFATSCIKDDAPALGDKGSAFIKIQEAPVNNIYLSPFTTIDTLSLFSLRREEVSEAELNIEKTITLINDTAALTAYNDSNGTSFEPLPDSLYALVGSGASVSGNTVSVTIPAGTIGYEYNITMNGGKWDISHKYALYLKITDSAGFKIRTDQNEVLVTIQVKNAYDANYQVTGWFFHPSSGRAINMVKHLSTLSLTSVEGTVGDLGSPFDFDIVDNKTVWLQGPYTGEASSNGFMTSDNPAKTDYSSTTNGGHLPGDADYNSTIYNNTYDPATQTFYMHYGYNAADPGGQGTYTRQVYEKWVRIN